jgi:transposase
MKAIHGGKTKNDKIDSYKIAALMKGGNFPLAYSYPAEKRATRDLLRRRMYLSRQCGLLAAHVQNTNTQYNLAPLDKKVSRYHNREGVEENFKDPSVRKSVEADLEMIGHFSTVLSKVEWYIEKTAKQHDYQTLYLLKSIPGVGRILSMAILYEIDNIERFPTVQRFSSYARLIRPQKSSDGKWAGVGNRKIGNHHLKWAIKEAAILFLKSSDEAKDYVTRLTKKSNKGRALGIFTHKLGRTIYYRLKNKEAFDMKRFFGS